MSVLAKIQFVGMRNKHPAFQVDGNKRRALVIHATAGTFPGDHGWLQRGGARVNPVSVHFLINRRGEIYQYLNTRHIAWHAGRSSWTIDGVRVPELPGLNSYAIGIELTNTNRGTQDYPAAQYNACVELSQYLVNEFDIPQSQLVTHYQISPGRKTDPYKFPFDQFKRDVYNAQKQPSRVSDHWDLWGTTYPLDEAARSFGIPQAWYPHAQRLGPATSGALYAHDGAVMQFFQGGVVVYRNSKTAVKTWDELKLG